MATYSKSGAVTLTFSELSQLANQARTIAGWATRLSQKLDEMQSKASAATKKRTTKAKA